MEGQTECPQAAEVVQFIHERRPQIIVSAIGVADYVLSELQLIATSNDTIDVIKSFDPNLLEQMIAWLPNASQLMLITTPPPRVRLVQLVVS